MGWPDGSDLSKVLIAAGVCKEAPEGADSAMRAAVRQFLSDVGIDTFLASGTETRRYDPPFDGVLWLDCQFLTVDSVHCAVSDTDTGVLATLDTDYRLVTGGTGQPVERIIFTQGGTFVGRTPRSVSVTGVPGAMTEDDPDFEDVSYWLVRQAAASFALEAGGSDGAVKRVKQGMVEVEYSGAAGLSRIEQWQTGYSQMVARYRRTVF